MRRRLGLGRIPRLVWCITGLYFGALLLYSVLMPAYRAPDEAHHVDLAHLFAEEGRYPSWDDRRVGVGVQRTLREMNPGDPASQLAADEARPRSERPTFESREEPPKYTGINHISQHPPLYYVLAGSAERVVEVVTDDLSFDQAVWVYRLVSMLLVVSLPLIIWSISQRLGLPSPVTYAAMLVPLAVPQFLHIGSAVNNDSLVLLTLFLSTAMVVRFAQGDLSKRTALLAGAIVGAGLLTKGFALVLPAYGLAGLGVAVLRGGRARLRPALLAGALGGGLAFVIGGWWWVRNLVLYGELNPSRYYDAVPVRDDVVVDMGDFLRTWYRTTTIRFWGSFGRFDVDMPLWLVVVATCVVAAGVVVACIGRDKITHVRIGDRLLLAAPLLLLVGMQFAFALWNYARTGAFPGMQGRYWFGALAGMAVVMAVGYARLLRGHTRLLPLVILAGAVAMNAVAVPRMLRFYWGDPGDDLGTQWDAMAGWSPFPHGYITFGAVVVTLLTLATAAQFVLGAPRPTPVATTAAGPPSDPVSAPEPSPTSPNGTDQPDEPTDPDTSSVSGSAAVAGGNPAESGEDG